MTRVRGRTNVLAGLCFATFPVIFASAPVVTGALRVPWVFLWLGLTVWVIVRAARMSVTADASGLGIRNFGRVYHVSWIDVASIEAGQSDNITRAVTTIVIRRRDGTKLIGRGASSYSRSAVEHWRDELVAAQRTYA